MIEKGVCYVLLIVNYQTPDSVTRQELAEALTGPDPFAQVESQLRVLDGIEAWVAGEKEKWQHIHALVGSPARYAATPDDRAALPGNNDDGVSSNGQRKRPTRREAALRILDSDPRRAWKLSEIVAEFSARGWGGKSQYEDHLVLRTLSTMVKAGQVTKPQKGYYKLVPQQVELGQKEAEDHD